MDKKTLMIITSEQKLITIVVMMLGMNISFGRMSKILSLPKICSIFPVIQRFSSYDVMLYHAGTFNPSNVKIPPTKGKIQSLNFISISQDY